MSPKTRTQSCEARNQLAVATGKTILIELDVVFQAVTDVPAQFEAPLVDFELMASNSRSRPRRIRHKILQFVDQPFQHPARTRAGMWTADHNLNLTRRLT